MRIGTIARSTFLLTWLVVFSVHAGAYLMDALGLTPQRDVDAVIETHVGFNYQWLLHHGDQVIGTLEHDFEYSDGQYPIRLDLSLSDLGKIPMINLLAKPLLRGRNIDLSKPVDLTLITTLDNDFRLRAIEVSGDAFGYVINFAGNVDHRGLYGVATVNEREREVAIKELRPIGTPILTAMTGLPPGLEPNERFTLGEMRPTATPPYLRRQLTVYQVGEPVERETAAGTMTLLPISIGPEGGAKSTIWATANGRVYEMDLGSGLRAKLRFVNKNRERIWPEPAKTDRPAQPDPSSSTGDLNP